MLTSKIELEIPAVLNVSTSEDTLAVDLDDGRSLSVPLAWYPRLLHATPGERAAWRIMGRGYGLHWDALDEDISVENLLAGHRSGESQHSFERWLESRNAAA
ncbi:MAG TPA: DUF2442 domain-containing protein [Sulfuriferula sp.]|nr:DUF2442 domain-containing protein [Sulfuriferula sp.]